MFHIQFFFTVWVEAFLFLKFSKYPKIGIMVSVKKLAQGNKNQSLELAVLPSLKTQKRQQIKYFKHICYLMDIRHYFHVFVYFMTCCSQEQNFRSSKFLQGARNKKGVELSFLQLKKLRKKGKAQKFFIYYLLQGLFVGKIFLKIYRKFPVSAHFLSRANAQFKAHLIAKMSIMTKI